MSSFKDLIIGLIAFTLAHIISFYQLNGQFLKTSWFRKNEILLALLGVGLSFLYIWGTKYTVSAAGGLLWPARFIGFGVGIIIYTIMVNYHFNEGMTPKTWVSLILSIFLICIQVIWK